MERVIVQTPRQEYEILAGWRVSETKDALDALTAAVADRRCLLVSDSNVAPLYSKGMQAILEASGAACCRSQFPAGESSKTLATVEQLYHTAVTEGLGRDSVIIALGGGVVGDLAGFVAATYMRGIRFLQVPTSLLAMVDSSVGGKVGVDLTEGKNLVGAFHQPCLVLADLAMLQSLPARELRCGLAEVIKYGVIMDAGFFDQLESQTAELLALAPDVCEGVIARCCELKAEVVREDERERTGRRAILNYGHTFGHALETLTGYARLRHGEGVAIGMSMAAELSVLLGLAPAELAQRQDAVLRAAGLPVALPDALTPETILEAMKRDKKVARGKLRLVLARGVGAVEIIEAVEESAVLEAIRRRCGRS